MFFQLFVSFTLITADWSSLCQLLCWLCSNYSRYRQKNNIYSWSPTIYVWYIQLSTYWFLSCPCNFIHQLFWKILFEFVCECYRYTWDGLVSCHQKYVSVSGITNLNPCQYHWISSISNFVTLPFLNRNLLAWACSVALCFVSISCSFVVHLSRVVCGLHRWGDWLYNISMLRLFPTMTLDEFGLIIVSIWWNLVVCAPGISKLRRTQLLQLSSWYRYGS